MGLFFPFKDKKSVLQRNNCKKCTTFEGKLHVIMRKSHIILLILLTVSLHSAVLAQESTSIFNFLNLPTSAHITALGGKNISLIEDDISLAVQNPALLSSVSDKTIGMGFMTYMQGVKAGSASYSQFAGERGTWGLHTQFTSYGELKETNIEGETLGKFSPLDFCLTGQYSYTLTDWLAGGAAGKFIYSHYGEFTSMAMAVDIGLNYYNEDKDLSISAVARNIGVQLKKFGDHRERVPFDMEVGLTAGLGHAPARISVTMVDLTRWKNSDYHTPSKSMSGGAKFFSHFVFGLDIIPTSRFYISAGYNYRRVKEMVAGDSSHAAGFTFGGGVNLKRIKVGLAYAKYHVSAPTFALNLAYNFQKN